MKRETQHKRDQEMKKFKFEAAPGQDDAILEELGGLEDSEEEEKPVSTAEVKENSSPK